MEKQIMDILNIGIGLLQAGKEGLEKAKTELEKTYTELSAKGAQDNSEGSVQIRQSLDKIIGDIKEFTSVAGKNYEDTRSKIIDNYNKITEEIQSKMPEGKVEAVKAKITEVAENIKKVKKA
ncbi:MAG: chemotaxis protein [Leptospiraceae bacterium]|nr:chemotaxis protein [Leptospiraceae bacterium]